MIYKKKCIFVIVQLMYTYTHNSPYGCYLCRNETTSIGHYNVYVFLVRVHFKVI